MKRFLALAAIPAVASQSLFLPRQVNVTVPPANFTGNDTALINLALAIENLQNAFYTQALSKFDEQAFNSSGYSPAVRNEYLRIQQDKQAHINLLGETLGTDAEEPCNYTFPINNVSDFTQYSRQLEDVGTSAYLGILPGLQDKNHLTVAASIMGNDARYASWIASFVNGVQGWGSPFETPLTPNQTLTLAVPFVSSCPSGNPQLPFSPSPALQATSSGGNVTFTFNSTLSNATDSDNSDNSTSRYAAFVQGLNQTVVPLNGSSVSVPYDFNGTVYALVTNSTNVTDSSILAGPAILIFDKPLNGTSGNGTEVENGGGVGGASSASAPASSATSSLASSASGAGTSATAAPASATESAST